MDKNYEKILLNKGIRPTAMRLLVIKYLDGQTHALSLNIIADGMNNPDRVTLYRTIKTFQEKGLVHSIEDGISPTKFALYIDEDGIDGQDDLHIHFYCTDCRETYCLPRTNAPNIPLPAEFQPKEINMMVKGICSKCSKRLFNNKNRQ